MQVHLKQTEIELALKLFIREQGISLVNKKITISFTAGRKDSGLSAEVTIESASTASVQADTEEVPVIETKPEEEIPVEEAPVRITKLFS